MKEWPLVVFTLATQLACGLTLAATAFEAAAPSDARLVRPLALLIFPILAIGVAASAAHLGRPWEAWRALRNLRRSRLSLELLLTCAFALLALLYSGSWFTEQTGGRILLGAITCAGGIAAVLSGALVYQLPTQPAWNSGWVPTSFLGTTLLLGGLLPALSLPLPPIVLHAFLAAAVVGSLLLLTAALWMLAYLSRQQLTAASPWLIAYLLLVAVLPAALVFCLWPHAPSAIPLPEGCMAAVLFGAVIGRAFLYWLPEHSDHF